MHTVIFQHGTRHPQYESICSRVAVACTCFYLTDMQLYITYVPEAHLCYNGHPLSANRFEQKSKNSSVENELRIQFFSIKRESVVCTSVSKKRVLEISQLWRFLLKIRNTIQCTKLKFSVFYQIQINFDPFYSKLYLNIEKYIKICNLLMMSRLECSQTTFPTNMSFFRVMRAALSSALTQILFSFANILFRISHLKA